MGQVTLSIHSRNYVMSCDDGQEEHLTRLGEYLDEKIRELSRTSGGVGEARLLVMAALLISDELFEARKHLSKGDAPTKGPIDGEGDGELAGLEEEESDMALALDTVAERIEAIAANLRRD